MDSGHAAQQFGQDEQRQRGPAEFEPRRTDAQGGEEGADESADE